MVVGWSGAACEGVYGAGGADRRVVGVCQVVVDHKVLEVGRIPRASGAEVNAADCTPP